MTAEKCEKTLYFKITTNSAGRCTEVSKSERKKRGVDYSTEQMA